MTMKNVRDTNAAPEEEEEAERTVTVSDSASKNIAFRIHGTDGILY